MHEQDRYRGGCHTGDAHRLPYGLGSMRVELLLHFDRESTELPVIDVDRQSSIFLLLVALDLIALTFDVAVILRLDLDLLGNPCICDAGPGAAKRHQRVIRDIGTAEK